MSLGRLSLIRQCLQLSRACGRRNVTSGVAGRASILYRAPSLTGGVVNKIDRRHYSVSIEGMEVSYERFRKELERGDELYIIDVREAQEIEMYGQIPNARLIPLSELEAALRMSEDGFKTKYGFDKPSEDGDNIFYCHIGKRSLMATVIARSMGFEDSRSLSGGYEKWLKENKS